MRTTRTTRALAVIGVLTALAGAVALSTPGRAGEPLRSGTIISGTGETPVSFWVRGAEGCVSTPNCSAWLQSGCDPALTGINPGPQSAIVDIEDVVDANPDRTLEVHDRFGINSGDFLVQFWTETGPLGRWDFCEEVLDARVSSWVCERTDAARCEIRIPYFAKWMTITSSPDNVYLDWELG